MTVSLQRGVAYDLDQAVGHGHGKARGPLSQKSPHQRPLQGQAAGSQAQLRAPPGEEPEHPHRRGPLGEHRGQSRPAHPQAQPENKHRVQHNVQYGPEGYRTHTDGAEALGVDEGIHTQADHHKDGAQHIDGHVIGGIGVGHVAGPKEVENRPLKDQTDGGQPHPKEQEKGKGVSQYLLGPLPLPPAPVDGTQGAPPAAAAVGKADQDRDDGQAQAQPGQRQPPLPRNAPDVHPVHQIIEDVDKLSRRHGQCQAQNVAGNTPLGKVVDGVLRNNASRSPLSRRRAPCYFLLYRMRAPCARKNPPPCT